MNKIKSILLSVIGLLCSISVSAHDFEVDGIYYNITSEEDKTVEVTCSGDYHVDYSNEYSGAVTIPESVVYNGNTYSVTSIGKSTFENCSGLTSVEIPNCVTNIGEYAFARCYGLTSMIIPNSITNLEIGVFAYCNNLTSVEIGNSVKSIGNYAFFGCSGLTSMLIPHSVNSIGYCAFYECDGLKSVMIGNGVVKIGEAAFGLCTGLTSVKLGKSVTSIGEDAFALCSSLVFITSYIPKEKLLPIGANVFKYVDTPPCILYVPYGAKDTYASTKGWSDFENIVEMAPTEYDFTISTAGYATLYLDYATEIPEGVEVYTAKEVDGISLKMAQVEKVLPANTAAIVKAPAGTYNFVQTATDAPAITDNLLKGTTEDTYIDVPSSSKAFVLSMVDGEVGMYLAKLTDGHFLNNANKAYLLLDNNKLGLSDEELDTSVGGAQLSLRFDFGGATGVDKVQTETGANNATYDMYGRKVNNIITPGFYIVNGKKVLVK